MMESLGFLKNCCIKRPQIFLDCFVGNKIALKNTIKAVKSSAHKTMKWHNEKCLYDSAFPLMFLNCDTVFLTGWPQSEFGTTLQSCRLHGIALPGDKSGLCVEAVACALFALAAEKCRD